VNDSSVDLAPVGCYVLGSETGKGIRKYPYSTDMTVNPHKYSTLNQYGEVHDIGEVWATMLFELYWTLVDKLGFTPNWKDEKAIKGNIVAMQLLMGGLALQPCNPSFLQARDAIILADENYYNGTYNCDIWKSFAKRGLGIDATAHRRFLGVFGWVRTDGFESPSNC
jgi:extracellular elastinolytic metalloproteinase